jgi:hypothetical protein
MVLGRRSRAKLRSRIGASFKKRSMTQENTRLISTTPRPPPSFLPVDNDNTIDLCQEQSTMMKSILAALFLCVAAATAFQTAPTAFLLQTRFPSKTVRPSSPSQLHVFGNKKTSAAQAEKESKYWQGEWVCKDCGYIYNRVSGSEGVASPTTTA